MTPARTLEVGAGVWEEHTLPALRRARGDCNSLRVGCVFYKHQYKGDVKKQRHTGKQIPAESNTPFARSKVAERDGDSMAEQEPAAEPSEGVAAVCIEAEGTVDSPAELAVQGDIKTTSPDERFEPEEQDTQRHYADPCHMHLKSILVQRGLAGPPPWPLQDKEWGFARTPASCSSPSQPQTDPILMSDDVKNRLNKIR